MTEVEILDRWKLLAGSVSAEPWTKDDLVGFFQAFRPHGHNLAKALEGIVGGKEILARLLEVYEATVSGWDQRDAYFVVKNPRPISKRRAEIVVRTHLSAFAAIAIQMRDVDLLALLEPLPSIEVVEGRTPWPPRQDDAETLIFECRTSFIGSLTPLASLALLLEEALYHIACDYFLRDYILWPLYRQSSTFDEPFGPYFELWKHGGGMRFVNERLVRVFVPALVD